MRALKYGYTVNGERRLTAVTATMAGHITDDRGAYRIYGLAPGEYTIAAPAIPQLSTGDAILMMTDSDVQRALDEVRSSRRSTSANEAPAVAGADEGRAIGYATVFYPGTPVPAQSVVIPLGRAEERNGVDFQLQYVPMSTIRGSIIAPPSMMPSQLTVHLIAVDDVILSETNSESRRTSVTAKGEFSFANVPPGSYVVVAKAQLGSSVFWASTSQKSRCRCNWDSASRVVSLLTDKPRFRIRHGSECRWYLSWPAPRSAWVRRPRVSIPTDAFQSPAQPRAAIDCRRRSMGRPAGCSIHRR
jgi:hypothetical protein